MSNIARRQFIQLSAVAAAGCLVAPGREAKAQDMPRLEESDPVAQSIVKRAGELLGRGFATLVSLFEPEKIIVGGGMAEVGDLILKPIEQTMANCCYLIARGYISVEIVRAKLGDDAGIIGAARLVFERDHETEFSRD